MVHLSDDTSVDPFTMNSPPLKLINFATGIQVSEEVESSLLICHRDGERLLEQFVSDRFMTQNGHEEPSKSFYDHVAKHNV